MDGISIMKVHMGEKIQKNYFFSFLGATIVALVLTLMVIGSVRGYGTRYDTIVIRVNVVILTFWMMIFIMYAIYNKSYRIYNKIEVFIFSLIMYCVSIYISDSCWHVGLLSLNPVRWLANGSAFTDNLYHSAIAGGYSSYGIPCLLLNELYVINDYHTLSHAIIGLISHVIGVPTYFVYCYIYPTLMAPIFVFLLLLTCSIAKEILSKHDKSISLLDTFIIAVLIIGWLPKDIYKAIGATTLCSWESESLVFSLCFLLAYFAIAMSIYNGKYGKVLMYVVNPVFILLTSASKISTGVILFIFLFCLFFLKRVKRKSDWIVMALYVLILVLSAYLFTSFGKASSGTGNEWQFLHYVRTYGGGGSNAIIYVSVSYITIFILLLYVLSTCDDSIGCLCFGEKYIIIKCLVFVSVMALLPGFFLKIAGGSANYFVAIPPVIGVIAFIGYDVPGNLVMKISTVRSRWAIEIIVIGGLLFTILCNSNIIKLDDDINEPGYTVNYFESLFGSNYELKAKSREGGRLNYMLVAFGRLVKPVREGYTFSSLWTNIEEINTITTGHKKEYAIYVDETSEMLDLYSGDIHAVYFYPALTNLLCLNITYSQDGNFYNVRDEVVTTSDDLTYGFANDVVREGKKDFKDIICTVPRHIKYVIVLYEDKYKLVDVEHL